MLWIWVDARSVGMGSVVIAPRLLSAAMRRWPPRPPRARSPAPAAPRPRGGGLRRPGAALLHADQAEAEVRDDVAHDVVRLLALRRDEDRVPGAGQLTAGAGLDAALCER